MADAITVAVPVPGDDDKTIHFGAGKYAGLADGAVTVQLGDTVVLVTATAAKSAREGADFFPLTVDIEERMYAAGKIPGSFFRREGKAPDQAILTCRLIDRPLRPCFPDGFRNEVHVVGTTLAADLVNPHDVVAINGASAALMLSGIPFDGPIGAVRLAYTTDGTWIPFPTYDEGEESTFEMVVAGRALDDGGVAISMVEAGGTEASWPAFQDGAPKVDEAVVAAGLQEAESYIRASIEAQRQLMAEFGVKEPMSYGVAADYTPEVLAAMEGQRERIVATQVISDKAERLAAEAALRDELVAELAPASPTSTAPRSSSRPPSGRSPRPSCAAASSTRASASTVAAPRTSGRCRPRSACSRRCTAPGCSSAARPRCSTWPPWACPAWSR